MSFAIKDGVPSMRFKTHDSASMLFRSADIDLAAYPMLAWRGSSSCRSGTRSGIDCRYTAAGSRPSPGNAQRGAASRIAQRQADRHARLRPACSVNSRLTLPHRKQGASNGRSCSTSRPASPCPTCNSCSITSIRDLRYGRRRIAGRDACRRPLDGNTQR